MPWKMGDAPANTKKANTPAKKHQFASVANAVLAKSGNEGKALRVAKAAVAKHPSKGMKATGGMKEKMKKSVTKARAF